MDFSKALEAMKAGKKVRRSTIPKNGWLVLRKNSVFNFYIDFPSGAGYGWDLGNGDILSKDWEIVPDIPEVQLRVSEMFYCPNCLEPNHGPFINYKNVECKECGLVVNLLHKDEPKTELNQSKSTLEKIGFTLDFGYGPFSEITANSIIKDFYISRGIKYPETKEEALKILDELSTFRVPPPEIATFKGSVNAETSQSMSRECELIYDQWLGGFIKFSH